MSTTIVGIDASDRAQAALRWALGHARSGDEVVAVHVWQLPLITGAEAANLDPTVFEREAEQTLADAVARVDDVPGDVKLRTEVVRGHPGQALLDRAADADLLVVGSRGHGGFAGLLLGSTSTYAVHHAACPVVVVPVPEH